MQSLYERAKADNRRILNDGFHAAISLTNPASGASQTVEGFYVDAPLDIDPQSGLPVKARRIAVHVHTADLTIGNPAEVAGDWRVSFTNNVGQVVSGIIEQPLADRTLGMLSFVVKLLKVVE